MKKKYTTSQEKYLRQIGSNIRLMREKKGLSQEALALKAGLDRTYVGGVDRGERNITILTLKRLADALETQVTRFFLNIESRD
ncbi:MAG: helix-turn-helix domain-containing protein [Planctomycetota bacterium]|jgi:transcriptional regulator with XRE-family HTH domain